MGKQINRDYLIRLEKPIKMQDGYYYDTFRIANNGLMFAIDGYKAIATKLNLNKYKYNIINL